jgi:NADH:ubiquinone oxidoreductase subunit C
MIESIKQKLGNKIIKIVEHNKQRVYIDIDPKDVVESARLLFTELGIRFVICTGTDTPAGLEILYHYSDDKTGVMYSIRVLIKDKTNPEIDSVTPTIKGAEWIEREMWELLGIKFRNHPNLKRLLLAPDWPEGSFPMRQGT